MLCARPNKERHVNLVSLMYIEKLWFMINLIFKQKRELLENRYKLIDN